MEVFEQRPFLGGKVASYVDRDGNHVEMGLHVFFGCYFNLFRLMAKASRDGTRRAMQGLARAMSPVACSWGHRHSG